MARYTGAVCRICRREGQKLFLKGERCYSEKCSVTRRAYAPGQHGQSRKKISEYGIQLRAKQKAKKYYGVLESQFAKYFVMAEKKSGVTGENLLKILESRFDNVIYRLGFALSRAEARQLIVHRHYNINGKRVNVPSYLLKEGDIITINANSMSSNKIKSILDSNSSKTVPIWLNFNNDKVEANVLRLPNRDEIDLEVSEHLIVELYSK